MLPDLGITDSSLAMLNFSGIPATPFSRGRFVSPRNKKLFPV
jgi:hypothetical protein